MRALINNFKCVDISPIFDRVTLEKRKRKKEEWDELHINGAVIMGFQSQLE